MSRGLLHEPRAQLGETVAQLLGLIATLLLVSINILII